MRISPTSRVGLKHSKVKKACDSPFFLLNHSKVKPQVSILSHVGFSSLLPSHSEVTGPQKYWSLSFSTVRTVQITSQQKSTYTHMHACVHMHTPLHNHMHVYTHTHTHTHTHTEDWKGFSLKAVYMDREDFLKDIPIVHVREEWTFLCTVYTHTCMCMHTHAYTHAHIHTHKRTGRAWRLCCIHGSWSFPEGHSNCPSYRRMNISAHSRQLYVTYSQLKSQHHKVFLKDIPIVQDR